MDLIDRQAAKKVLLDERVADDDPNYENAWECNRFLEAAVERLNDLPTADVRENVRGKWDKDGRCTVCGEYCPEQCNGVEIEPLHTNFCPNCGADMRERRDDG